MKFATGKVYHEVCVPPPEKRDKKKGPQDCWIVDPAGVTSLDGKKVKRVI